ncbi:hypothetical protein K450DRAFT_256293 [Umbelopsis ramanniana AG]|uniref:Uncharacterized protein n=1 Tax=Umbelopsis ramanniana AG TaxID=1314678 RepID=A0AAD5E4A8_UMBRA|nr:uncharacterized protein K450DRAFT_256293 [Umbelopsis ramanniana AG]KAI8576577.1 hypothetical protein K450DRAFT_256293 [Umbelopsis ramanniana AG]
MCLDSGRESTASCRTPTHASAVSCSCLASKSCSPAAGAISSKPCTSATATPDTAASFSITTKHVPTATTCSPSAPKHSSV